MNEKWWDVPSVPAFHAVATRFIAVVDDRHRRTAGDLLHAIHPLLAELYLVGFVLPVKPEEAFGEDDDNSEPYRVDQTAVDRHHAEWKALHQDLEKKIGPKWNYYQEVFDPYAQPIEEPVTGSLADDLADIYLDLMKGQTLWASGQKDEAVWEWRFGFESDWGEHVTGALRAIRTLAASHDLGFPQSAHVDV